MKKIYSLYRWTVCCIEAWFGGIRNVWTDEDLFWDLRQTFFYTDDDRRIYRLKEDQFIRDINK